MIIFLIVTALSGPLDGIQTGLVYPSYPSCQKALKPVSAALPYDHSISCEVYSIRPKRRPEQ